jgi:predicted nucleic acid-binding protein
MTDRFFLDTNILVYAHEGGDLAKQSRSRDLIYKAIRTGNGILSPQVLGEFYVTVTRKIAKPVPEDQARRELVLLSSLCTVDMDATLVIQALDLRARWQVSYWDALILAAAERSECEVVYSEDLSAGQQYGTVQVRNPYT